MISSAFVVIHTLCLVRYRLAAVGTAGLLDPNQQPKMFLLFEPPTEMRR